MAVQDTHSLLQIIFTHNMDENYIKITKTKGKFQTAEFDSDSLELKISAVNDEYLANETAITSGIQKRAELRQELDKLIAIKEQLSVV